MHHYKHKLLTIIFLISIAIICSDSTCTPKVSVKFCKHSIQTAKSYSWKSEINLLASLIVNCDSEELQLKWRLWKINPKNPTHNKLLREVNGGKLISIKASELELGFYLVKLHAKMDIKESAVFYENDFSCYFKIKIFPLKPVIMGVRFIKSRRNGLVLSATRSVDPNQKDDSVPLMSRWTCTGNLSTAIVENICKARILKSTELYVIPGYKLPDLGQFTFTLEIWSNRYDNCDKCVDAREHQFAHRIIIIDISEGKRDFISITCPDNCIASPMHTDIVLKADLHLLNSSSWPNSYMNFCPLFQWTYQKVGDDTESISYKVSAGLPPYIFQLPEGTLKHGSSYIVNATTFLNGVLLADSFLLETFYTEYNVSCAVEPQSGVRGETTFDVICAEESITDVKLIFEFYDMTPEQANDDINLSGRILGTTNSGHLKNVLLTRGTVVVAIRSYTGFHLKNRLQVELKDKEGMDNKTNVIKTLKSLIETGSPSSILRHISVVTDVFSKYLHEIDILNFLVIQIHRFSISTPTVVKQTMSTLHNLLLNFNSSAPDFKHIETMKTIKLIVLEQMKYFSLQKYDFLSQDMIEIIELGLNNLLISLALEKKLLLKMPSRDVETKYVSDIGLLESSALVETILDLTSNILIDFQRPGMPPTTIASANHTLEVWALVEDPAYSYSLGSMLETYPDIPIINMSTQFLQSVKRNSLWRDKLSLCLIKVNENIFHWLVTESTSNLLSISLSIKHTLNTTLKEKISKIKTLVTPITMKLNLNTTQLIQQFINGETTQLDPNMESEHLDMLIKVHRFDPEPQSLMSLTFLYPPTNNTLRVIMMRDYQPTYEMMVSKSELISERNPVYLSTYIRDSEPISFYYLAVLPGPEVPINHSVKYSFSINSKVCTAWSRMQWSSVGCQVGPDTQGSQVYCQCKHLSIFAVLSRYLPNQINPFSDAKLFLTVRENPLVVSLVLTMFIVYLIISVWAYRKDKKDRFHRAVTVLDDNLPGDRHAFLLAVYTSSRFFAGTSANVGVQLIGENAKSRVHILSSQHHQALTRNSDDWFLIFSPELLGPLKKIHIWHDNTGFLPAWHCDKIIVYDLKEQIEFLFVVDEWLELSHKDYPEVVVVPTTLNDVINPKSLFPQNVVDIMKCKSVSIAGVYLKHPRLSITRFQMSTLVMCTLLIALLCSIMFYRDPEGKPDDYAYNVSQRDIIVSFIALCISVSITWLIRWEFNKSLKRTFIRNVNTLCVRDSQFDDFHLKPISSIEQSGTENGTDDILKRKIKESRRVLRRLTNYSKPKPLHPVTLANGKPVTERKIVWLTIAWSTCILIMLSCMYLIMLYGLKMGLNKSKKWITSVVLSVVEDSFFTSPISIFMAALLISTADLCSQSATYLITKDELYKSYKDISGQDLNKLLIKRSHPMYHPIADHEAARLIVKKRKIHKLIKHILFLISLFYVIVVGLLLHSMWSSKYYINSHLVQLISLAWYKNMGFFKSCNSNDINSYLETTFLNSLYSSKWYNNRPFSSEVENEYWTSDYTWKMVGPPSIRQLRVEAKDYCSSFLAETICIPAWTSQAEENGLYNIAWLTYEWRETPDGDPWSYTDPNVTWFITLYRLTGATGVIYNSGGYTAQLCTSLKNSFGTISELVGNSWQDQLTSAVFVELTLFNVNLRVFSQITLIIEYSRSVDTFKTVHVFSAEECTLVDVWLITFTLITIVLSLCLIIDISHDGFICFVRKLSNVVFMISVLLGFSIIVIHLKKVFQCLSYSFGERYGYKADKHFNYDYFVSYHLQMALLLAPLLLLSIYQVVLKCQEGIISSVYVKVFGSCLKSIFFLEIICCISMVFLWQMFYQTNILLFGSFIEFITCQRRVANVDIKHFNSITLVLTILKVFIIAFISSWFITVFKYINKTVRMN